MPDKKRLIYLDSIKGAMILFVLYYHVLWVGVNYKDSPTKVLFDLMCMQTFFFVSGFCAFKINNVYLWKDFSVLIFKKLKFILIPTFLMFSFCAILFKFDYFFYLCNDLKYGYWFTFVLFLVFLIQFILLFLLRRLRVSEIWTDFILILIGFLAFVVHGRLYMFLDLEMFHILSLQLVFRYYIFFVGGYLVKKHYGLFEKILKYNITRSLLLIVSFISVISFDVIVKLPQICLLIAMMSLVFLTFNLFSQHMFFGSNQSWNRHLALIGRHSMEIYFIHYLFLFNIPYAHEFIIECQAICFKGNPGFYLIPELLIISPISIILAYISMGVRKIIDFSPDLSKLLFGAIP